jgi:hypothetical protein
MDGRHLGPQDASGHVHVNLDSCTPCWNDQRRILLKLTEIPPRRIFKGGRGEPSARDAMTQGFSLISANLGAPSTLLDMRLLCEICQLSLGAQFGGRRSPPAIFLNSSITSGSRGISLITFS